MGRKRSHHHPPIRTARQSNSTDVSDDFEPPSDVLGTEAHPLTPTGSPLSSTSNLLIPSPARSSNAPASPRSDLIDPKAKRQATLLLLALIPEGILEAMLIPLYPFIVRSVGDIPESQVGYYTGLLGSAFYAPLLFMNVVWGFSSDRIGRRPILILGLTMGILAASLLTFGTTFAQIFTARVLAGAFGSNSTISKGMLGELFPTGGKGLAWGVAMYGCVYGLAGILGPVMAGALVNPHLKWPALFGNWFEHRPFALASGLGVSLMVVGWCFVVFGIKESRKTRTGTEKRRAGGVGGGGGLTVSGLTGNTVPRDVGDYQALLQNEDMDGTENDDLGRTKPDDGQGTFPNRRRSHSRDPETGSSKQREDDNGPTASRPSTSHPLLTRRTLLPIAGYCAIAFVNMVDMSATPLFFSAPRSAQGGGLGLTASSASLYLSTIAITKLIGQLFCFRFVLNAMGKEGTFSAGVWAFTVGNAAMALLVSTLPQASPDITPYAFLFPVLVVMGTAEVLGYLAVILLITDSVTSEYLGLVHGLASTCSAATRTVAPAVAGSLWQWGLLGGGGLSRATVFIVATCFGGAVGLATLSGL
ncbi:hypothetical protein HKX48_004784 [Thoreauomyces humboldtii]|nr:hypothetical protein HKX48_004784 [Thoreauomyces humboldtii]